MAIRTYKVTLDSKNTIAPEPVFLRQGDKTGAVVIDATLMDNGTPVSLSGLTPMFKANTADGKAVIVDSTGFNIVNASGGEFTYQVPSQLGSVDGKIKIAYFSFLDSSGAQSTFNVAFIVKKAADMTQESAKDWISTLSDIIRQYNQWANDAHNSWEQFVNDNKEIIESIDPGGKVLSELIDFRHSDMLGKSFDTARKRGDFFDQEFADRGINVRWFGAVGGGTIDDTAALQSTIDYAHQQALKIGGIVKVIIPFKIGISGTINLSSNVILTGSGSIKCLAASSLSTPVLKIAASSENCGITDIEFDMNHLAGCLLIVGEDVKNLSLKNMKIKDCYDSDSTTEQVIIFLETGISGLIDSIDFKLIKKLGNNVTTDGAGRGSCIKTSKYGAVNFNPYDLTIKNVSFEDCYNVNAEGEPIVEDFDCIYLFHQDVPGSVRVKNINAKNINKRVIKIQANGVDVDGVYAKCDGNISCQWVISVFYNNNSVKNVVAEGNFTTAIEFLNATNSVAENITLESTITGNNDTFGVINIFNSSGITVNGLFGRAVGGLVIYGPVINRVTINNVDLQINQTILRIEDRAIDNDTEKNCILSNITFDNVKIVQTSGNTVRPSVRLNQANEGGQIKYINFNNVYITFDQEYQWGLFALKSIRNLYAYDVTLINKTGNTNNALAISSGSHDLYFTDLKIENDSYALQIGDDSTVEIFRGNIGTILMTGANTTFDLGRLKHQAITYQSGAIETNVKTW